MLIHANLGEGKEKIPIAMVSVGGSFLLLRIVNLLKISHASRQYRLVKETRRQSPERRRIRMVPGKPSSTAQEMS